MLHEKQRHERVYQCVRSFSSQSVSHLPDVSWDPDEADMDTEMVTEVVGTPNHNPITDRVAIVTTSVDGNITVPNVHQTSSRPATPQVSRRDFFLYKGYP